MTGEFAQKYGRWAVIVGGFNAYPAEIEGFLLEHPAVAQVAVACPVIASDRSASDCCAQGCRDRGGTHLMEPGSNGWLQGAAIRRVSGQTAARRDRQSDEGRIALSIRTTGK